MKSMITLVKNTLLMTHSFGYMEASHCFNKLFNNNMIGPFRQAVLGKDQKFREVDCKSFRVIHLTLKHSLSPHCLYTRTHANTINYCALQLCIITGLSTNFQAISQGKLNYMKKSGHNWTCIVRNPWILGYIYLPDWFDSFD